MVRECRETDCASQVAFLGNVDYSDYCIRSVAATGLTSVRAPLSILADLSFWKVLEEIVVFGELIDAWALPMRGSEVSMFFAGLSYLDFTVFLG